MRMVRVLRGGSWYILQANARCSYRNWYLPVNYWTHFGMRVSFRLVRRSQ